MTLSTRQYSDATVHEGEFGWPDTRRANKIYVYLIVSRQRDSTHYEASSVCVCVCIAVGIFIKCIIFILYLFIYITIEFV